MSQDDSTSFFVNRDNKYDRLVMAIFGICFQLAEIMLVVGAFRYAGAKTGSVLLNSIAIVLGFVGAAWLGLILPNTVGRLEFWKKTARRIRYVFAIAMICRSTWLTCICEPSQT